MRSESAKRRQKTEKFDFYGELSQKAEAALQKKLDERFEIVEITKTQEFDEFEKVKSTKIVTKQRLIEPDKEAAKMVLEAHCGGLWNKDEQELRRIKGEKLKAETERLKGGGGLGDKIVEQLRLYL